MLIGRGAEIEQIGVYVCVNLAEWMANIVGLQILGPTIRVEHDLICTRLEAVDKRF